MTAAVVVLACLFVFATAGRAEPWPAEKANGWYAQQAWPVGCNFIPSTAINQLEMWQADTFDLPTIKRELGWAKSLGFNTVRVFLHDIAYEQDPAGFFKRVDEFLGACDDNGIKVMFVLFDSVWDPFPKAGKQRAPHPHVHNSGWVQGPGVPVLEDLAKHEPRLKAYVQMVVTKYKRSPAVLAWDVINEPDNRNGSSYGKWEPANKGDLALELMKKAYGWAREADPAQPLTSGVWIGQWGDPAKLKSWEKWQLEQSDVISFHAYGDLKDLQTRVNNLKRYGRPILCTEYMARPIGSNFEPHLGWMKENKIGAYNWGFVNGKSQTIYPWDSWQKKYTGEPPVWFHDIFQTDGKAYREAEVEYIRRVTK
ncbi:MAG: cellulase family glycosylhydrolase [Phycisphaerae bacterium]